MTEFLDAVGPRLGVPTLRACCPQMPRSVLTYLLMDYRQQFQAQHTQVVETLHWKHPGAVWAIDHSQPPRLVDGCYPVVLAIRDLASGMQLAWTPVTDAKAPAAIEVLEHLVQSHGAPLVLKSDNGSAFVADEFRTWLDRQQVVHLRSPVRMPRFNGACEAGIGAAKRRTEYLAARHDRHLDWSTSDLSAAQEWANEFSYPGGLAAGTPASRFAARQVFDQISRDTFQCAIVQCEHQYNHNACTAGDALTDTLLAVHRRRAIRQALVELGYLDITRRSVPQPLHVAKCARIT